RERLEHETHRQCEHVQKIDKAEIGHRHAEDARIRAVNDGVASVENRTPQRLTGVVSVGNVKRDRYADERERAGRVGFPLLTSPAAFSAAYVIAIISRC